MQPQSVLLLLAGVLLAATGVARFREFKKRDSVMSALQDRQSEILALLESIDGRVARIEENQAEQLLSDYESHRARLLGS
jgi:hypothetical protein